MLGKGMFTLICGGATKNTVRLFILELSRVSVSIILSKNLTGSAVRYAPDRVLFDSVEAVKGIICFSSLVKRNHKASYLLLISQTDIYGYNSNVIKSTTYNALLHRAPNILTARDRKQHGKRKRIISQGFSDANLRSLEKLVISQIDNFCKVLSSDTAFPEEPDIATSKEGWGPARDLSKLCKFFVRWLCLNA